MVLRLQPKGIHTILDTNNLFQLERFDGITVWKGEDYFHTRIIDWNKKTEWLVNIRSKSE
jgi:ABC-type uncharacterized transport system involved in gliding motility auxiliary subunit